MRSFCGSWGIGAARSVAAIRRAASSAVRTTEAALSSSYHVDPDVTVASTLPSTFYRDAAAYDRVLERVFARSWQWIGDTADVAVPGTLSPREMLPGSLAEPLLL